MHKNHYFMNISRLKTTTFCTLIIFICSQKIFSQDKNITVNQDSKFEELLNEKRKINASITISNRYKIQIYNGDSDASKKTLADFKKTNKDLDANIVFNTPIYKVWVGNFKTRIDAERNLILLKKTYPSAFLIKPNR